MTAFRIGVDARAFSSPAGGVRRYTWEIYGRLARMGPEVDVTAVGATADTPLPEGLARRAARAFPTNVGWTGASLPLAIRGLALDVFHAPAYTAPLWGVHPQAVTIHDVSPERVPQWNAYKNDRLRRWFYRRSALAADRVITDSEFSQQEIAAAYAIPLEQISVVALAAAETFRPGPFDPALAPPGVRQPYVLHVGDLQVRRNLTTALAAVLRLRRGVAAPGVVSAAAPPVIGAAAPLVEGACAPPLVAASAARLAGARAPALAGTQAPILVCAGVDRGIGAALVAESVAAGDPAALILTGSVSEGVLLNLYRGAAVLAYPSRYEGFGLPILEAMQCGIPVVAARTSSIPELVGDAGPLLEPLDVEAWTEALRGVLSAPPAAAALLRDASLARAGLFSWDRTARETLAALRACAASGTGRGR